MWSSTTRRGFGLLIATGVGGTWLASGCAAPAAGRPPAAPGAAANPEAANETAPAEDLMREHGLLERILVVFEEGLGRDDGGTAALGAIHDGAQIVRRFVEDYHEKLEEDHLFPRLEQAGKLVGLVATLRAQHQAGRRVTDAILATSAAGDARSLAGPVHAFIRMYRPHAAREDTVLFPAFKALLPRHEYDELGERFEEREHQLFGAAGFEGIVEEVAALEKAVGIDDLETFTPR